jgi:DNA (cytosine-5)-methyltransferase 1
MKAIGAYIFAGGFTVGVSKHFDVACHLEETNYGVATARRNFPDLPIHYGPDKWPLDELKKHEWDFVYGNPPCAAWSVIGNNIVKGIDWRIDPRINCTRKHFSLLEDLKPSVWAWESVQRAWTAGEEFVRGLAQRARALGYSTTIFLHDAQYLGVPQRRQRFFMVAHRIEVDFEEPAWEVTTIEEALRGINDRGEPLERIIGMVRWLLPHIKQGENLSSAFTRMTPPSEIKINNRGQVAGRPPIAVKRARAGQPAPVIMQELLHPTEDRGLSIRELATLCGYPTTYEFTGNEIVRQIGRGVCPPVGEYLARQVARAVRQARPVREPTLRLVDYTTPKIKVTQLKWEETVTTNMSAEPAMTTNAKPALARAAQPLIVSERSLVGEGSGAFIRRLLQQGYDAEHILQHVHASFPNSKATKSDISWNKGKLRKMGIEPKVLTGVESLHAPQPQPQTQTQPQPQPKNRGCKMMTDMFDDVRKFHARFGLGYYPSVRPTMPDRATQVFRIDFMQEELDEFDRACIANNLAEAADALADLVWVALGTAHMMGLPFNEVWAEVARANMEKVRASGADDPRSKRGSALDVVKPDGWRPPDHALAIGEANETWQSVNEPDRG